METSWPAGGELSSQLTLCPVLPRGERFREIVSTLNGPQMEGESDRCLPLLKHFLIRKQPENTE